MVKNQLSLRFEEKLLEILKKIAEERNITLNGLIEETMRKRFLLSNKYEVSEKVKVYYKKVIENRRPFEENKFFKDFIVSDGKHFLIVDDIQNFPVDDNDYVFDCTYTEENKEITIRLINTIKNLPL